MWRVTLVGRVLSGMSLTFLASRPGTGGEAIKMAVHTEGTLFRAL